MFATARQVKKIECLKSIKKLMLRLRMYSFCFIINFQLHKNDENDLKIGTRIPIAMKSVYSNQRYTDINVESI